MIEFNSIDWADSDIEKIEIEYDRMKLYVFNDTYSPEAGTEYLAVIKH